MKNKTNKRRLGELLCTHNIGDHIEMVSRADSVVTHDEADVSLMLDAARRGAKTVHILSDDTDVFVLMALVKPSIISNQILASLLVNSAQLGPMQAATACF